MQEGYRTAGFVRLCFEKLLPLMVLNLLFLLTCLPVLTAPTGWVAFCRACQSLLLGGSLPYFTAARGALPVIDDFIMKE